MRHAVKTEHICIILQHNNNTLASCSAYFDRVSLRLAPVVLMSIIASEWWTDSVDSPLMAVM